MPLIDIPERQTPAEVSLIVWSYMLHPENRDDAIEHFAKLWLLADSKIRNAPNDEVLSLPASFIKALIAGPSLDEMASTKQLRLRSGFTAGALLISMYITSALNHKISMSRAIHLVERSKLAESDGRGVLNVYGNRPEITAAWKLMRPVAHFFAAQMATSATDTTNFRPLSAEALVSAARLSNGFLQWGCETSLPKIGGGTEPILDRATAWAVREDDFPATTPTPIERGNLPTWLTTAVEQYTNR